MKDLAGRDRPLWYTPHGDMRTDAYVLLAALLRDSPSAEVTALVGHLHWNDALPQAMHRALGALKLAGTTIPEKDIAAEYHRLFVGLGSGELVPYASWYREKKIQSAPLASIRGDLRRLGIVRQSGTFDSEDHAGALCEVMALLSDPKSDIAVAEQADFFDRHLLGWLPQFFRDLQHARDCPFYRTAGAFGDCFFSGEEEYLRMRPVPVMGST